MPEKVYEGKAKILYHTSDPGVLLAHFKDDATAFNAQKRGQIVGKGKINCQIAAALLQELEAAGIPTHYISCPEPDQMLIKAVQIIPLEVVVRNIVAGSLCRETNLPLGLVLPEPLVEFYYKSDQLGDPLLTSDRLKLMNLATPDQIATIQQLALKTNQVLQNFFADCGITLVDFKLEFGLNAEQQVLLADEVSPDTCRLWDAQETDPQKRILDKDRFRQDLGNVEGAYQQVLSRVKALRGEST